MKKVISTAIILSLAVIQTAPCMNMAYAQSSTATPKQFKSMVKKDKKKVNNDYKYEYVSDNAGRVLAKTAYKWDNSSKAWKPSFVYTVKYGETSNILSYAAEHVVTISALAYYPNTMDGNPDKRKASIEHLYKVIDAASFLGIDLVTTFIGRVTELPVEDNLEIFAEVWPPIIKYAASKGVRIGIENCPMLFDRTNWPGGQNLFTSPVLWRKMFEIIPDRNFGINFDPSHFVWQQMDYIAPIYEFKDRIFHVHFKDIKLYPEKLKECGVMAYPLDYMDPKIPGYGDVEWKRFVSALTDIRYDGFACVEVEDRAFEGSKEKIIDSLKQSYKYMRALVI